MAINAHPNIQIAPVIMIQIRSLSILTDLRNHSGFMQLLMSEGASAKEKTLFVLTIR